MDNVNCPDCKDTRVVKYGKTAAGLQKYRCVYPGCRRQFVAGSDHMIDPETKYRVEKLLYADVHPTQIAKAETGISLRWIYELRKRMKNA